MGHFNFYLNTVHITHSYYHPTGQYKYLSEHDIIDILHQIFRAPINKFIGS